MNKKLINELEIKIIEISENLEISNKDIVFKYIFEFYNFLKLNKVYFYDYLKDLPFSEIDEAYIDNINIEFNFGDKLNFFIEKYGIENFNSVHITEIYEGLNFCKEIIKIKKGKKHSYDTLHHILFELYKHLLPNHIKYFEKYKL